MKTKPGEVGAETGLGTRHAKIGDHRQTQTAADGGAVNCGDDGLFGAKQTVAFDVKMRGARPRPAEKFATAIVIAAEIGAGTK